MAPMFWLIYLQIMTAAALCALLILPAMASDNTVGNDMWTVAQNIIVGSIPGSREKSAPAWRYGVRVLKPENCGVM